MLEAATDSVRAQVAVVREALPDALLLEQNTVEYAPTQASKTRKYATWAPLLGSGRLGVVILASFCGRRTFCLSYDTLVLVAEVRLPTLLFQLCQPEPLSGRLRAARHALLFASSDCCTVEERIEDA